MTFLRKSEKNIQINYLWQTAPPMKKGFMLLKLVLTLLALHCQGNATIAYTTSANDIGKMAGVTVNPDGKVGYYQAQPLGSYEGFNVQYPLKRG